MSKVNNKDIRTTSSTFTWSKLTTETLLKFEICSKLAIKTPLTFFCGFIINFVHILHFFVVFLLLPK